MSAEERNDTEEDDMDHECNKTEESELDDLDSSSSSESEESSDIDEETIETRKHDCVSDLQELEHAFQLVRQLLYVEKTKKIDAKLKELAAGTATEYTKPLKQLMERQQRRVEVAGIKKKLLEELIWLQHDSEQLAAHQNLENDKRMLYDTVRNELEEKIRRLEEDRNNLDVSSDLWETQLLSKAPKKKKELMITKQRRKKPMPITGPFIIYMLKDSDIIEDWTIIKKQMKLQQPVRRKPEGLLKLDRFGSYSAKYEEGMLNYRGAYYKKGDRIMIDNKEHSPVHATITAINMEQICVKKSDGNKSKLFIAQLQKGKYTIKPLHTVKS